MNMSLHERGSSAAHGSAYAPLKIDPAVYKQCRTPSELARRLSAIAGGESTDESAEKLETAAASPAASAPETSYSQALWNNGIDGLVDKASRDLWSWVR